MPHGEPDDTRGIPATATRVYRVGGLRPDAGVKQWPLIVEGTGAVDSATDGRSHYQRKKSRKGWGKP